MIKIKNKNRISDTMKFVNLDYSIEDSVNRRAFTFIVAPKYHCTYDVRLNLNAPLFVVYEFYIAVRFMNQLCVYVSERKK